MKLTPLQAFIAAVLMLLIFTGGIALGWGLHRVVFELQLEELAKIREYYENKYDQDDSLIEKIPLFKKKGKREGRQI